jgi:putative ABC transport system substrate-binding protein
MRSTDDPVELGWVASLARPGGNITGVTSYSMLLTGKRMELLTEAIPQLSRIAVLWNPEEPDAAPKFRQAHTVTQELGMRLQSLEVRTPNEFESAFKAAVRERAGAIFTLRSPLIVFQRKRIAELALKARLPAIYDDREFVEAGGLMSYGANLADAYRRAAIYVDRILKGASPAEIPVEQPRRFELYINLKTAGQIGLTVPPELLLRADKVIR